MTALQAAQVRERTISEIMETIGNHVKGVSYSKLVEHTQDVLIEDSWGCVNPFIEVNRLWFVVKLKELHEELEALEKTA
jgi:hypothetical protein